MAKRSRVQLFEQIRRARERDGEESVRGLARRFGVHRRDVRAALASPVPPPRKAAGPKPCPKLDPWKPVIDKWLADDRSAPRKQRHTARRVWQRLTEEHGVVIGESTVRRYVAEVKARQDVGLGEVMVPQSHPLGAEGEVDYGDVAVKIAGVMLDVPLFVFRLSASGGSFVRAYLSEAQEGFLDGHVRAFEHFGGVPGRVRYDNLKAAVSKMLKGRSREESDRFALLRSHYGFESFFCQPGIRGAHEKGGVESEVGRFRRRHMVPVPAFGSLGEFNVFLERCVAKDLARYIAHRRITVGEHLELEAPTLRPLPVERFDVSSLSSHRVDRHSRISVRSVRYSVPVRYVERRVEVRVGADTIEVLDADKVVATHIRGIRGDEILTLDHYLEVLKIKPGALPSATAPARARAAGVFTETPQRFWDLARQRLGDSAGTKALIEVLLLHRSLPADAVTRGLGAALGVGSADPAVVAIEARNHRSGQAVVIAIGERLHRFDRPKPTLDHYDTLLEAQP